MRKLFAVMSMVGALGGVAAADTFEEAAVAAHKISSADNLVFPFGDECKVDGGDMARRACLGIRASRRAASVGKSYFTVATGSAKIGDFDVKGQVPITVRGCVVCQAAKLDGQSWFITTKGAVSVEGGFAGGPALGTTTAKVADKAAAEKYAAEMGPVLGTEVVFTLTNDPTWSKGDSHGIVADIVAWRLVDRCTGEVLLSKPESAAQATPSARPEECGGKLGGAPVKKGGPAPGDEIPDTLSHWDVQRTMATAKPAVNACQKKYSITGNATAQVEIQSDGTVKSVSLKGDFNGTPTGSCIIKAVQVVKFPAFKKGPMRVEFPFILR